jgi:acid stress chaperone HdeB
MKFTAFAAACAALVLAMPAQAETIDVSTLKCSDITSMNAEEGSYILVWLHGYYGGQANDTTIDLESFEAAGTAIGAKCAENPELGVMTAIKQIDEGQ